jgi:superoxide dismutase, Cu-Zn family
MKPALLPITALILSVTALSSCTQPANLARATTNVTDTAGKVIGTAVFEEDPAGLKMNVTVTGLVPNTKHGFHVHTNPACTDTTDAAGAAVKFGGAGAHFDPTASGKHTGPMITAEMGHAGDLPNLVVDANGVGTVTLSTKRLTVRPGTLSVVGHSVIVHANEDNYADTPAPLGGSGGRMACGVISAS